jgi:hypothetical protein
MPEDSMPSPFPGMDPYLEGHLWPDVHSALANKIRQVLAPALRPRYVVRLEIYVVEDTAPELEVGIMYPDVEILLIGRAAAPPSTALAPAATPAQSLPTPLTIPVLEPIAVRVPTVEIRDAAGNQLVTSIEILSPVNKREPGLATYRQKRQRLYHAGVHLIEIDLLRRGSRPLTHPRLPDSAYQIALTRALSGAAMVWPIGLRDALPTIPIPLRDPDPDSLLPLGTALTALYDEASYDLSIDYHQPPPPPSLGEADAAWMRQLISS